MRDREDLLRELHHRVKNNFQIIASLMNLQKRMLPPERRGDLRFVEEHVQSMAVAYRIVAAGSELVEVPIGELVRETIDNLRQIAGARSDHVHYDLSQDDGDIELNQGIVLGLLLAVVLPPYLDHVVVHGGLIRARTAMTDGELTVSLFGIPDTEVALDFTRKRLLDAYVRQLRGEMPTGLQAGELRVRFPLEPLSGGAARNNGKIVAGGTTQVP
jgi:hypothetical protein